MPHSVLHGVSMAKIVVFERRVGHYERIRKLESLGYHAELFA